MHTTTRLAALLASVLCAATAYATNGYFTDGVGTKNKGLAGAGSADPEEAMIVATNPAGLAFVDQHVAVGLELFSPDRSYSTSASLANGNGGAFTIGPNDMSSDNKLFALPYIAMSWKIDDQTRAAAAFYGRGGMNTKWSGGTATFDPDGPGPAPVMTLPGTYGDGPAGVDLMQGFLNLSVARATSDRQFAVGGSLIFAIQRFEARGVGTFAGFTKTFAQSGATVLPTALSDNGHDMSYGGGGSLGVQWNPAPNFSLALAYTSKMFMSRFTHYSDLFADRGKFDIPASATLGLTLKPTNDTAVSFDVQRIWYSGIDSVHNPVQNIFNCPTAGFGGTDLESCLGGSNGPGFGWQDITVYKLGARFAVAENLTARLGVSHTTQPIPGSQMTFNILAPGVIENHFAVGLSWRNADRGEFNFAVTYMPSKTITGLNNFDPTQSVQLKMHQFDVEFGYAWR